MFCNDLILPKDLIFCVNRNIINVGQLFIQKYFGKAVIFMSTKEIVTSMLDCLNEEQLNGIMVLIRSFIEPNDETKAAIEECEAMLNDPEARRYKSVDELFEDLDS